MQLRVFLGQHTTRRTTGLRSGGFQTDNPDTPSNPVDAYRPPHAVEMDGLHGHRV